MKVHLVGEAAGHAADLTAHLDPSHEVVALPADAATTGAYDDRIDPDDVVVSLRFRRPSGQAPAFRLLHVPGAGLDGIDLDALRPETAVANVFEHEIPIAEFVLARLLDWEIRAGEMTDRFTAEGWPEQYRHRLPHGEVHGKTLGLLGYGRIGRAVAARASAFGMRVLALDDHALDDRTTTVFPPDRLHAFLAEVDHLVVACPLTAQTTGLIDRPALAVMKAHAVVINVSRAEVVDEDALYEALTSGAIGGAVLDVWYRYPSSSEPDPPPAHRPFWDLPNVWCTPHSSAWTRELSQRRYAVIAANINRLATGGPLSHLVRPSQGVPARPLQERR
ncbi:2-hydroxyacid dehydrogenase [Actinomycetospora corticicola]|uniref:Phosphoglycerate dehydrogenase-like enzyme n=1 Tax=Actinomycetospora corticicola TaxID=663602 RepID=A0A7Y9J416_9PSEU|nr:phosphoglycerate dehydrogenase-like enzyme [Actinomycetospora corticicola]